MKAKFLTLALLISLNSFSQSTKKYSYSPSITFEITKIKKWKHVYDGGGYYYPSRGAVFIVMFITVNNQSDKTSTIDFGQFYISESENGQKFKPEKILAGGMINVYLDKRQQIKPKATKKRKLVFLAPKNFKPKQFGFRESTLDIDDTVLKKL